MAQIIYLHGFASSPNSTKAQFFYRRLLEHGKQVLVPALDQSNFRGLTITNQLAVIDRAVGNRSSVLIGSSLGGYLAVLYASTHSSIERLVLLAPAFRFPSMWRQRYADQLARWRQTGSLPFYHFGSRNEQLLDYRFVEDAALYPDGPLLSQEALILHGSFDPIMPLASSVEYAATHSNVQLRIFTAGHELTEVLEPMWVEVSRFLGISLVPKSVERLSAPIPSL